MSKLLLLQLPSVPMPTLTPASIIAFSGAMPHASLQLETGHDATLTRAACKHVRNGGGSCDDTPGSPAPALGLCLQRHSARNARR
jgi:hypothetical protein